MVLDGAIASEAWSQLVRSILSNTPPRDMSRDYYYTSPETGSDYLHKQSKRLERYKYKLGTKNIQTRMRYGMRSEQVYEDDGDKQGIEHIRPHLISTKHSQTNNADESPQDIEHVRESTRSTKHSQPNVEPIPYSPRSVLHSAVVVLPYEDDEIPQGIEHVQYCLISSKHSQGVQREEDESEQGIGDIRGSQRSSKHNQLVRVNEDEDENLQGIEYIRDCPRSNKVSQVVQTKKEEYRQESAQDQSNEAGIHIEHTRDSIKSTVSFKPAEYDDRQLISDINQTRRSTEPEDAYQQWNNYKDAMKMSTLFDELLEVIEKEDLIGQEKPTLRFQVLKVIKLLHHYGIDIIKRGVEKDLEDENQKCDEMEQDTEIYYKKKGLETMLRLCNTESCQTTIYDIIGKAERHQVFFI